MKKAIILPVYEPDEKFTNFVSHLIQEGFKDIIVVNDGSSKETVHFFEEADANPEVTLLTHEVNKGKGAGLKTAFAYLASQRKDIEVGVTCDGDGQHTVESLNACLEAFEENPDTVIIGGRTFDDKSIPFRSRFGNKLSKFVYRFACGIKLNDTQTGLRIIPSGYFEDFSKLKGDRYEYETNMLIEIADKKIPYLEVPIETIYIDDNETSHFNPLRDSLKIYGVVLKYFFKFLISSILSWLVDIGIYTLVILILENRTDVHTMEIAAGIASRVISSVVNYIINRKVVFKSTDKAAGTTLRYYILAVCQMAVSILLVDLFADQILCVTGAWHTIVKCVCDGCLFLFSYNIQRKWVFRNKQQ